MYICEPLTIRVSLHFVLFYYILSDMYIYFKVVFFLSKKKKKKKINQQQKGLIDEGRQNTINNYYIDIY